MAHPAIGLDPQAVAQAQAQVPAASCVLCSKRRDRERNRYGKSGGGKTMKTMMIIRLNRFFFKLFMV